MLVYHVDKVYTVASITPIKDSTEIPMRSVLRDRLIDGAGSEASSDETETELLFLCFAEQSSDHTSQICSRMSALARFDTLIQTDLTSLVRRDPAFV